MTPKGRAIIEFSQLVRNALRRCPARWIRTAICRKVIDAKRRGNHICYISDLRKMKSHFPGWEITRSLDGIIDKIIEADRSPQKKAA